MTRCTCPEGDFRFCHGEIQRLELQVEAYRKVFGNPDLSLVPLSMRETVKWFCARGMERIVASQNRVSEHVTTEPHNHQCSDCHKEWRCEDKVCRRMLGTQCRDCGRNSY
jgi:hypothetical protein